MAKKYVFTKAERIEMVREEMRGVQARMDAEKNIDHLLVYSDKMKELNQEIQEIEDGEE
jgi:hypothetical protein